MHNTKKGQQDRILKEKEHFGDMSIIHEPPVRSRQFSTGRLT